MPSSKVIQMGFLTSFCTNMSFMFLETVGEVFVCSHVNPGTQKASLRCLQERRVPLLNLNCGLDSCEDGKECHAWNVCILLCVYNPHCAAGLNSLYKDAVQLFLRGST